MNNNSPGVKVILRDGFLEVIGEVPGLRNKLRYYRRAIEQEGYERKVVSHYEDLYTDDPNDPNRLVTMSGFAHKVLDLCRKTGTAFEFVDARTPMPEPNYEKAFRGLRDYQIPLVGRMLKSGGGILRGSTGLGKTIVSASIIKAFDRNELYSRGTPTCVFACPDRDINRKNWQEFQKWLPDREVGLIMSGTSHKPSNDVVCCTIDSLENIDPEQVGVLIVDEMHASASAGRAEKISLFQKARKWGVSATPTGRFDGADIVAEGLYGPIVAEFTYQDGVRTGALVPITVYWLPAPEPLCGLDMYGRFQKRETKIRHGSTINDNFGRMVADIFNCTPDNTQILGIMAFIEQMYHVHKFCRKTGCIHAETNADRLASYPGIQAIKAAERKRIYDDFKDGRLMSMLATQVWAVGVDFRNLSVVVNIGGGGSEIVAKQVPGRASRKADGKDHAYVVDFIHPWDREDPVSGTGNPGPLLKNDISRRKAYKQLGFEQCNISSITELPFLDPQLVRQALPAATQTQGLF